MDVKFADHGTIWLAQPLTPAGEAWISEHLPEEAQWFGSAVVIEPRYVGDIAQGIADDGLQITNEG